MLLRPNLLIPSDDVESNTTYHNIRLDDPATNAINMLEPILKQTTNPAAVFDIDETLILNLENDGFTVHEPVKRVYDFLQARGVAIFIVTARRKSEASADYAQEQIFKFYRGWKKLYMVNKKHNDDDSASIFKFECRQRIIDDGYTIILNCGDNWSDLGLTVEYKDNEYHRFKDDYPDRSKHYVLEDVEETSKISWKVPNKDYVVD